METIKKLIDSFVSFFQNAETTLQFGIILILAVIGLFILIAVCKIAISLFRLIVSLCSRKKKPESEPSEDPNPSVLTTPVNYPQEAPTAQEKRVILYLDEELRKFRSNMSSIPIEELKEEKGIVPSSHNIDNLSREQFSELSERKKKDIQKRFKNLGLRDLKRQRASYSKKQQASAESVEKESVSYRALLLSRDKAENECTSLYSQHKISLVHAITNREKVFSDSKEIEYDFLKTKEALENRLSEKERLYAELKKNSEAISELISDAGKLVISAYQFVDTSKSSIAEANSKYHEDAAAYLGRVSELNAINNDLSHCLENYTDSAKENAECSFALNHISDSILEAQAAIEEQKRKEAEEAERIRKEKEAERERIKLEKQAEAERQAKEKAELEAQKRAIAEERERKRAEKEAQKAAAKAEREAKEAEQRRKERDQAILLAQQEEMLASNQKAESALSKAEELDKRSELLEKEKAEIEERKRAITEERERERAEKEAQKAAAKAEREAKEAEQKAQKAAREKAELEALEELTEEEKEVRRQLEQMNNELISRSSSAAEEGFVNEKRLAEIRESQATLEQEQAKRTAEKEALRLAVEQNQQRIIENNSTLDAENNSPEEQMDAIREQWRLERESKERFEAEQAKKALEIEERKRALADSNNSSKK